MKLYLRQYWIIPFIIISLFYARISIHLTGIVCLFLVIVTSVIWGSRGGLLASIYSMIIVFLKSYSIHHFLFNEIVVTSVLVYFALAIGIGKLMDYLYEQQSRLRKEIEERQRAESEVLEKEEHFRSIVATVPDVMIIIDKKGVYQEVWTGQNDNLVAPRCEILGRSMREFLPPEVAEKIEYHLNQALEYNKLQVFEYELEVLGGKKYFEARLIATSQDRALLVARDISERIKTKKKLEIQRAFFKQLFDNSPEAIVITDQEEKIVKVNQGFTDLFGYQEEEVQGKLINDLIVPREKVAAAYKYSQQVLEGNVVKVEDVRSTKDGRKIEVAILAYPIKLHQENLGLYAIYSDISERKAAERKLKEYATYDSLTHAYNRRTGLAILDEKQKEARRRHKSLTLCFVDIDDLKQVNDTYGHELGDDLIAQTAEIIRSRIRETDLLVRIGGDEFLIIFPECNLQEASKVWQRVRAGFEEFNQQGSKPYQIRASHGLAEYKPGEEINLEELISRADRRMYQNKEERKAKEA